MPSITTHTIVRNEDQFVWYSLMSAIDQVDQMIVYDTGSTDQTVDIIKSISSPKIIFKKFGPQTAAQITKLRQKQLDVTKSDYFMILDGDEVWWKNNLQSVKKTLQKNKSLYGIITPTINCVGDIYHYQDSSAGHYTFAGRKGHLAVRVMKNLPGIKIRANYPLEGYYLTNDKQITDYHDKLKFIDKPYLHLTNLKRSSGDERNVISREKKYELGHSFSKNFKYPEVFYTDRPSIVTSPWKKMSLLEFIISATITPLKKIKRSIKRFFN